MRIILKCCHHTEPIIHREVQPRKQMKGKFLNVCLQKETMVCLFELRPQILQLAGSCSCLNPHTIKLVQVLCSPVHLCCYLKDESVCEFAFVTSSLTFKDRFTFSICLYLYTILTLLHFYVFLFDNVQLKQTEFIKSSRYSSKVSYFGVKFPLYGSCLLSYSR